MINITIQRDSVIAETSRMSQYVEVMQKRDNNQSAKSCNKGDLPILTPIWNEVCADLLSNLQPFADSATLTDSQFQIELTPSNIACNHPATNLIDSLSSSLSSLCNGYIVHSLLSHWYAISASDLSQQYSARCDKILSQIIKILRNAPNAPTRRSQPPI